MSVDLDATVGAATANAFVDVDFADDYLGARLNADAWNTEPDEDQKSRALIEATRELTILPYMGSRMTTVQALSWPRQFCINPDVPNIVYLGNVLLYYYDNTIVSPRVQHATCELALEFLRAGSADIASLDPQIGVIRDKTDVLETEYAKPWERAQGLARFPRVLRLIAPVLDPSAGGGLAVVRC